MLSVVRNQGIDRLRSQAAHWRTQEKAEAEAPRSQPSEAFAETWRKCRRDRVREALEDLPHTQRKVLALAHFSDLSHPQIAERLCLPLGPPLPLHTSLRKRVIHPTAWKRNSANFACY